MNIRNNKLIFIPLISVSLGFTTLTPDLKGFCSYFESEQLDSCKSVLNNYLMAKQQVQFQHNEYYKRFPELDSLIIEISKLSCVDTCFYKDKKGGVMKTNPPMTDIFIYKVHSSDTSKYVMRVIFEEPMKVVWLRKWEY